MKKETSQKNEKVETISDVMMRYEASFTIALRDGFAHIKFIDQKMYVEWLNSEGYFCEEGHDIPLEDVTRVADFMRDLNALRLTDYKKTV